MMMPGVALSTNMLEVLRRPEHSALSENFRERRFLKNNIIFTPSDSGNHIFVVKKGKVRVFLANEDKEFTLAILGEGEVYTTHTRASVQALTDATLLVSDASAVHRHASSCPHFSMATMAVLGEHLKNSLTIINRLAFKDVNMRLADFLLQEARKKGEDTGDGVVLAMGLSVKQIADVVGSSRQTVSTLLNEMQKDGLLSRMSRGKYVIHNMEELAELAVTQVRGTMPRRKAS